MVLWTLFRTMIEKASLVTAKITLVLTCLLFRAWFNIMHNKKPRLLMLRKSHAALCHTWIYFFPDIFCSHLWSVNRFGLVEYREGLFEMCYVGQVVGSGSSSTALQFLKSPSSLISSPLLQHSCFRWNENMWKLFGKQLFEVCLQNRRSASRIHQASSE